MEILCAAEISAWDRHTIENIGLPGAVLMENAGLSAAELIRKEFPLHTRIAVFCGGGNNGGDGYVIARHLHRWGFETTVCAVRSPNSPDAKLHRNCCEKSGVPINALPNTLKPSDFNLAIDAVFGTGLNKTLSKELQKIIALINQFPRVISIDIPSGICADTGKSLGGAVQAEMTITFQRPKTGHYLSTGARVRGRLHISDIGICKPPPEILPEALVSLLSTNDFLLPERSEYAHKNDFGHLLAIGGIPGKSGAIRIAGKAALLSGCGLITIAAPKQSCAQIQIGEPELMTISLEESPDFFHPRNIMPLNMFKADCLLIGPGAGRHNQTREFIAGLIQSSPAPLVLDADALHAFDDQEHLIQALRSRTAPTILTPHPGEFSALTGLPTCEIDSRKIELCRDLAMKTRASIVLKDAITMVAFANGSVKVLDAPNPVLAKAGSGDILAGLIASFICQKIKAEKAILSALLLQQKAAELLRMENTVYGGSPLALINTIPSAIKALKNDF
jgi:NAD(P)H-hydrate epimerase